MKTYQYKTLIFFGKCFKILAAGVFLLTICTGFLCIIFKETSQLPEITFFTAVLAIATGLYAIILIPEERTVIQADEKRIIFRKPNKKLTFSLGKKEIIVESSWQEITKVIISSQGLRKKCKVYVLTPKGNFSFNFGLNGYRELIEMIKTNIAPEKIVSIPKKNIKNLCFILFCVLSILFGLFLLFVVSYKK